MTGTEKAKLLFDQLMGAASFSPEKLELLKDIVARRQYIAQNYKEEYEAEFHHLNDKLREHMSL